MALKQKPGVVRQKCRYLVIGNGRMANHWVAYLEMLDMPCVRWARATHDLDALAESMRAVDQIFLAISDDSLESFNSDHLQDFSGPVYHFSGCHVSTQMHSCHPLMTFGKTLYDIDIYQRITLVLEDRDTRGVSRFSEFRNPVVSIPTASKPLYHALCVMSCNFPQIIWARTISQFEQLGIGADSLFPLLLATLDNSLNTPGGSITGPLARKDHQTMEQNINALKSEPEKELYRTFIKLTGS